MLESIELSAVLPASPERVYKAWLNGKEHAGFTGGEAQVDPRIGGRFTAWDGYIEGTTLELEPPRRILQSWRCTDFPPGSGDSRLEVLLEKVKAGTKITLRHTAIPEGQGQEYKQGWVDNYFTPMKRYFAAQAGP